VIEGQGAEVKCMILVDSSIGACAHRLYTVMVR
jgi:hypothetical protein